MIGLYAIGEILSRVPDPSNYSAVAESSKRLISMPRISEFFSRRAPLLRGTVIGTVIGIIPGAGATPAAFISYSAESSYGRNRKRSEEHTSELQTIMRISYAALCC